MKSDKETLDMLSTVSNVNMSSQKQHDIWNTIEKEVAQMKPVPGKRRSNIWGTGAAAAAAIILVVSGYYAFSNKDLNHLNSTPGLGTASHGDTTSHFRFPLPSEVQSVSVAFGPTSETWTTYDPRRVSTQVLSWLNDATLYTGNIPKSNNTGDPKANIGPAELKLAANGKTVTILPVYYLVQTQKNATGVRYVENVIAYQEANQTIYFTAPRLFSWLKNGGWQSEFVLQTNTQSASPYNSAQLAALTAQQLANYNVQHQQALPFAGSNVTRSIPKQQLLVSDPKSGSMNPPSDIKGATPLNPNDFYVIDRWSLTIPGNNNGIAVEVDKKTDGSLYLIGIANGPRTTAYSVNKQPYITNFTGSYIVFATPNPAQGNPFYAINVQTGALVSGQTAYQMSTDYGTMGGASGDIQGLSQSFSSLPQ